MAQADSSESISSRNSSETDLDRICEDPDKMEPGVVDADAALQRFLQQQRSDLMYELRRIQYGERPVTGQGNRENIASFLAKYLPDPQAAGASPAKNIPANVDVAQEHRPEAVLVEVQGVVEQRRVSSVLQSVEFRRHLENIIRGSIGSALSRQSRPANSARTPPSSSVPQSSTSSSQSAMLDVSSVASNSQIAVAEGAMEGSDRVDSVPPVGRHEVRDVNPQPVNQGAQNPVAHGAREDEGLLASVSRIQHDDMVYEISDLLHRRLVSSTLGSEFRTMMEVHIQQHLNRQQADGEAVANYIRNIQQSQLHVPNDFSHLGIVPGPRADLSDNISITGISATAVPYTQTNLHLSREMQSLRSQMEEMKNMLRLTFDLQMDIQRAIRQEVAAAIAATATQGATAAAVPEVRSTPVNDSHCLICLDSHCDSVLYQCGHMCVCFTCGKNLMTRGNGKCPVCRAPIRDIIRAYKTNME